MAGTGAAAVEAHQGVEVDDSSALLLYDFDEGDDGQPVEAAGGRSQVAGQVAA